MPARMISQKYAASNMMNVMIAVRSAPISGGRSVPSAHCSANGTRKKNQKITSTSGIERIRFTYPDAASASGLIDDSRAIASSVPKNRPPITAMVVSSTV